jgi:hypothetical protein
MLGVKDAGMMGEGIKAADWREGTMRAVAIIEIFLQLSFLVEI